MLEPRIDVEGDEKALQQLRTLDRKVQNRTIRKATNAAGGEVLKETKAGAQAIKQTGFTARSLRSISKSKKGSTTVWIGQQKQKQFKARKLNRAKGRNLSQIQRAGKPVPIHWIERGTKPHFVRSKDGKRLVFQIGRRTKFKSGLAFAKEVRLPGMKARHLLRTSARRAKARAAAAFGRIVRNEVRV